MPFKMVSAEEIQKIIDEDLLDDEAQLVVMEEILSMVKGDFTVFHNKEDDKYFAVPKGEAIPYHMRDIILGT